MLREFVRPVPLTLLGLGAVMLLVLQLRGQTEALGRQVAVLEASQRELISALREALPEKQSLATGRLEVSETLGMTLSEFGALASTVRAAGVPRIDDSGKVRDTFGLIPVSVVLPSSMTVQMLPEDPTDKGVKLFVRPSAYLPAGEKATLYGIGVADDISFEARMAQDGFSAYAYDCTSPVGMQERARKRNVAFKPYCIGKEGSLGNFYRSQSGQKPEFRTLRQVMEENGDTHIDLLKFDIEGYEWRLLEEEILSKGGLLPKQLMFEVHLQGSNWRAVPPSVVQGRNADALYTLFRRLFDSGYRVIHKQVNPGDKFCCDFTLIRF